MWSLIIYGLGLFDPLLLLIARSLSDFEPARGFGSFNPWQRDLYR